jgi:hypothetical protein
VGSGAIVTHAKDEAAKAFYRKFNFVPSPINDLHLYLPMKDVRAIFRHAVSDSAGGTRTILTRAMRGRP